MEKRITPTNSSTLTNSGLYIDQDRPRPTPAPAAPNPSSTTSNLSPAIPALAPIPLAAPRHRWIRPVRLLLWLIVIIGLTVGVSLRSRSQNSAAFVNGTSSALAFWANLVFWSAFVLATLNALWGITRWFLRWHREHWRPGRVAGKLIGGGIWRFCAITPIILLTLFLIAPPIAQAISRNTIAQQAESLLFSTALLYSDFQSGQLTADEYTNYLLDSIYEPAALPSVYQSSLSPTELPDYLTFVDEHFSELDVATVRRALEYATLANLEFDTDASNNIAHSYSLFSENAYAAQKATTLNKAQLSHDQRFVIFYTDTGDNAVSDDSIATLGTMLDRIVKNYQDKLGLSYSYELITTSNSRLKTMQKVLAANSISTDALETAMPVYIVNPYDKDSDTLATYAGRKFSETATSILIKFGGIMGEETAKFYETTPSYPFVNILPSNLNDPSLELVTAHELGHHYSSLYCYSTSGKACPNDDFIDETAPNWLAINVVDNQPADNVINGHHSSYLKYGVCYTISTVIPDPPKEHACHAKGNLTGYPAVAFLQNYSEIVPDSTSHILQALTSNNALQVLYEAAGLDRYRRTMTQLTQRNLTNEYGNKLSLYASDLPHGEEIPCTDLCAQSYYIAPSSSRYLYFPVKEFGETELTVTAPNETTVSILGRRNGAWAVLYSQDHTAKFDMADAEGYDTIAFALANYSITTPDTFTLQVTAKPLEEFIEQDTPSPDLSDLPIVMLSDNCIGINFESVIDFPLELYRALSQIDPSQDYSEIFAEIEARNTQIKDQLVYHYATLCLNQLKPGTDFNSVKSSIRRLAKPSLSFFNINEPDFRLSMITAYDPLQLEGKFYFLMQIDDELGLITVRMFEKIPEL